ncbi:MAG: hypothetical protein ACRD68_17270, partial [Pyrinomonadaceae bacterium]
ILGFTLRGERLQINPCIPRGWREYEIVYRHGSATYEIKVENPLGLSHGVSLVELDGEAQGAAGIRLRDDGMIHQVRVLLGEKSPVGEEEQVTNLP